MDKLDELNKEIELKTKAREKLIKLKKNNKIKELLGDNLFDKIESHSFLFNYETPYDFLLSAISTKIELENYDCTVGDDTEDIDSKSEKLVERYEQTTLYDKIIKTDLIVMGYKESNFDFLGYSTIDGKPIYGLNENFNIDSLGEINYIDVSTKEISRNIKSFDTDLDIYFLKKNN
jgi:hypothetical protein